MQVIWQVHLSASLLTHPCTVTEQVYRDNSTDFTFLFLFTVPSVLQFSKWLQKSAGSRVHKQSHHFQRLVDNASLIRPQLGNLSVLTHFHTHHIYLPPFVYDNQMTTTTPFMRVQQNTFLIIYLPPTSHPRPRTHTFHTTQRLSDHDLGQYAALLDVDK